MPGWRSAPGSASAICGQVPRRPETAFKIYAEVPAETTPAASALLTEYLGSPALPDREARLVLVGGAPIPTDANSTSNCHSTSLP